jgi:cell shape-determining protein MreC
MTLVELDLTVIAVCFVLITLGFLFLAFSVYRAVRAIEEKVDFLASQVEPAFLELKRAVYSISDSLKAVDSLLSFAKRFKRSDKKG